MKKQTQTEKETDTEFLARLMAEGFERVENKMVTKDEMNNRFDDVDKRFKEMHERFRILENIMYRGHDNRIEKLEDKMAQIQVILGKKLA